MEIKEVKIKINIEFPDIVNCYFINILFIRVASYCDIKPPYIIKPSVITLRCHIIGTMDNLKL